MEDLQVAYANGIHLLQVTIPTNKSNTGCKIISNYFFAIFNFGHSFLIKGHCNFQNGLCGLRTDKNDAIQWTVGSGQTPTESTGPSHDHTSFNKKGKVI